MCLERRDISYHFIFVHVVPQPTLICISYNIMFIVVHVIQYHIISYHIISNYIISYHLNMYHIMSYHFFCIIRDLNLPTRFLFHLFHVAGWSHRKRLGRLGQLHRISPALRPALKTARGWEAKPGLINHCLII